MYAIVEISGKQFSVREKDRLIVPHLEGNANDSVTLDRVLLIAGNDGVQIGTPVVPDASVNATILEHVKGDKILVFRKKRRKRFKVKRGHRQPYTRIEIGALAFGEEKEKKPAAKATTAKKPAAKATTAKKPAAKATTAKKPAAKATTAKKPAAKATTAKKPAAKATTAKKPAAESIPPENEASS